MIVIGDLHLGIKAFDRDICQNHINYLKTVIDYSAEKDDKIIFQLGDIFNNRQVANIFFMEQVKELFEYLKAKNVVMYSLLGNHDIFWRESREVSLVHHFETLYPKNFKVFKEKDDFEYFDKTIYVVPWLVKGEGLSQSELKNKDMVFGHLEIAGFEMAKGHYDERSSLSEKFFKKLNLPVLSGHYHIRNVKGLVKYLGTPYQLNWGDFNEIKGFYILDKDLNLEFIENDITPKHIKLVFNQSNKKPLEIKGLTKTIRCDLKEISKYFELLKNSYVKFLVNHSEDSSYEEYIFELQKAGVKLEVLNNQKLNELIEFNSDSSGNIKPSKDIILDYIKENRPELIELALELFTEYDTESSNHLS